MSLLTRSKRKDAPAGTELATVAAPGTEAQQPAPAASKPGKTVKGMGAPEFVRSPRADLLPPEIGQRERARGARRVMRLAVIGVLVITVLGFGASLLVNTTAQASLNSEVAETSNLLAQQAQFADVRQAQQQLQLGAAALQVGGATDIDWQAYLLQLRSALPAGVTVQSIAADSAGITELYGQSDVPLEGTRIATIAFTANSEALPSIPDWLNALAEMPGFVDATPGSVTLNEGVYTAAVTMHINAEVFTSRFEPKEAE